MHKTTITWHLTRIDRASHRLTGGDKRVTQPLAGMVAVLVTGNTSVHCIMMCGEGHHHHEHIVETIMPQFDSLTLSLHHCLMCWSVLPVRLDVHGDVLLHCAPKKMTFWW